MKRLIVSLLVCILLFSAIASGFSTTSALQQGQSKIYKLGPAEYTILLYEYKDGKARFMISDELSPELARYESHTFSSNLSVSIDEFLQMEDRSNPNVKFTLTVPTTKCGQARCYPGERCVDNKVCEAYCGNSYCDPGEQGKCITDCAWCGDGKCANDENCASCTEDCGCDDGTMCMGDSCIKFQCRVDSQCGDNNGCTTDTCFNGVCKHQNDKIGCPFDVKRCLPINSVLSNKYCSEELKWEPLKDTSATCENHAECSSKYCINNVCTKLSFFNKFKFWFGMY
ncbi:MAG: hypothetical protein WC471_02780 [Candidatus Woesearchaeota archaeon]